MPVQFPHYLFVAQQIGVEVIQTTPVKCRRALAGQGFEAPVDRISKTQPAKSQQVETACADLIGSLKNLMDGLGPPSAEFTGGALAIVEGGEEARVFAAAEVIVPCQRRPRLLFVDNKRLQ